MFIIEGACEIIDKELNIKYLRHGVMAYVDTVYDSKIREIKIKAKILAKENGKSKVCTTFVIPKGFDFGDTFDTFIDNSIEYFSERIEELYDFI